MVGSFISRMAIFCIATGGTAMCASEVRVWGDTTQAPAGVFAVPAGLNNAIAISASFHHVVALLDTGGVVAWGNNSKGQCNVPNAALSNVVAIDNTTSFSFALKNDGTLIGWGDNSLHVLDVPANLPPVRSLHVQPGVVVAVLYDNTLRMWGDFAYQPPAGLSVQDAYPLTFDGGVAVKPDGSIFQWINPAGLPFPDAPIGLIAASLTNNRDSNITLSSDGSVTQWGINAYSSAGRPTGITGVIEVALGASHTIARMKNGTLVTWGTGANVPGITPPASWTNAIALSASDWYTVGIFAVGSPPETVNLSSKSIPYAAAIGTTVGDFNATDPDIGTKFTYAFINGSEANDNAFFTISDTHLIIKSPIPLERKTVSIQIIVRDEDGNSKTAVFPLIVTQSNNDDNGKKCGLGGISIFFLVGMGWLRRRSAKP